jgi:hypothetical protein
VLPHAVYLVQGILGLARLAVSYFLKDELHLDPATVRCVMATGRPDVGCSAHPAERCFRLWLQVGILSSVAAAPWVIKPIYGCARDQSATHNVHNDSGRQAVAAFALSAAADFCLTASPSLGTRGGPT